MPRPSQCAACGCFDICLYPNVPQCAAREESVCEAAELAMDE